MTMTVLRNVGLALGSGTACMSALAAYRYRKLVAENAELPRETLWKFPDHDDNSGKSTKAEGEMKRVVVIGGGVVGVTAAFKLAVAGHSVAVLEPRSGPGMECSACAAGGMQRSNPTVDKDSWMAVLKCIVPFAGRSNDFKFFRIDWFQTLSDPFFLRWVVTFTKTSLFPGPKQTEKQKDMLNFTKYAVDDMLHMMRDPRDDMSLKSGFNEKGSLSLSYENTSDVPKNPSQSKRTFEPFRILSSTDQIVDCEPSVRFQTNRPQSAKLETESCAASSERWTIELAQRCADKLGVTFLYDTTVKGFRVEESPLSSNNSDNGNLRQKQAPPRISQILTNRGTIDLPDDAQVVVAAGAWLPHVLALLDLYAPVYPLKGYAMSVSAKETQLAEADLPSRIVNDKYMYTCRLGDEIRITSIGEFSGWCTRPTPCVDKAFRNEAIRQFPQLARFIDKAETKCGHRPFVNDGVLLLGRSDTHSNLFISCGPGANGWKLSLGSGEVIAHLVSGNSEAETSHKLGGNVFDVSSFSPAGRVVQSPVFARLCRIRWGI